MPEKAIHISSFLRRNQSVSGLLAGVERDARLLEAVRRALGGDLGPHCLHAVIEGGRLGLSTDSPVWASRLRFAAPVLVEALRAQGTAAAEVRLRVVPGSVPRRQTGTGGAQIRLSEATVTHLREAAASTDDPALAAALLRLARAGPSAGVDQDTANGRGA
jgi:hypothetical protein